MNLILFNSMSPVEMKRRNGLRGLDWMRGDTYRVPQRNTENKKIRKVLKENECEMDLILTYPLINHFKMKSGEKKCVSRRVDSNLHVQRSCVLWTMMCGWFEEKNTENILWVI